MGWEEESTSSHWNLSWCCLAKKAGEGLQDGHYVTHHISYVTCNISYGTNQDSQGEADKI